MLGVAVVGCGLIAQLTHLENLAAEPGVRLIAVCDRDAHRLRLAKDRLGVKVAEPDYRDVVSRSDVDAVVIATEDVSHAEIVRFCLMHRKHVFVEKPLCLDPDEADSLCAAAARAGVVGAVGFHKVHDGVVSWLRQLDLRSRDAFLIEARDICHDNDLVVPAVAPQHVKTEAFRHGSSDYQHSQVWDELVRRRFPTCTADLADSYRVFLNLGCHDMATVISLYGEPSRVHYAEFWGEPAHRGTVVFGYDATLRCTLNIGLTARSWFDQSLRIYTPSSTAEVRWPSPFQPDGVTDGRLRSWRGGQEVEDRRSAASHRAFRDELRDFLTAIAGARPPRSPLTLGAAVLRWQFAALESDYARRCG